jgi:predicted ATPase
MQMGKASSGHRLVVITGGPCSGKTTLIKYFAQQGCLTIAEAALSVIEQLNVQMGVARQQAWRNSHPMEFQNRVLELQIQREEAAENGPAGAVFVDRGRLDGIAYLRLAGEDPPPEFLAMCRQTRYSAVFLLSTLARFEARWDTGRTESAEGSRAIAAQIRRVYEENGYSVIGIPELPVERRAALVLSQIAATKP